MLATMTKLAIGNLPSELDSIPEEASSRERGSREQLHLRSQLVSSCLKNIEPKTLELGSGGSVGVSLTPPFVDTDNNIYLARVMSADITIVANVLKNAM